MAIKIGFELELVYNSEKVHLDRGEYHAGIVNAGLPFYKVERDGSLSAHYGEFPSYAKTAECVSTLLKNRDEFDAALKAFYKFFSKDGKYKLNEVIIFNDTTGTHFHLSKGRKFKYMQKIFGKGFVKARKYLFKLLEESNLSETTKAKILKQYFRSYARKFTRKQSKNRIYADRRSEFNFQSEQSNKGLEWRSFNLVGVSTWDEFFEAMDVYYRACEYLSTKCMNLTENETETIKVSSFDVGPGFFPTRDIRVDPQVKEQVINIPAEVRHFV